MIGFIIILVVQFSNESQFSSEHLGLILSGTSAGEQAGKKQIQDITIQKSNIDFIFSRDIPLILNTTDGVTHRIRPESYELKEDGLDILFEDQVTLRFRVSEENNLNIQPILPEDPARIESMIINFSLVQGSEAHPRENLPIMTIQGQKENIYLALNSDSRIDMDKRELLLAPEDKGFVPVVVETLPASVNIKNYLAQRNEDNELVNYDNTVDNFINRAFRQWQSARFNLGQGTWTSSKGTNFYTNIAVATMAESLVTNQSQTVHPIVQNAASLWPQKQTWEGSTFFGDIVNKETDQREFMLNKLAQDRSLLRDHNLRFLYEEGGWEAVGLYGDENDFAQIMSNISHIQLTPNTVEILQLARNFLLISQWRSGSTKRIRSVAILLEEQLLKSLYNQNDNVFLTNQFGELDLYASLLGGWVFQQMGSVLQDDSYTNLGKQLVLSSLKYERGTGNLPLYLDENNGEITWNGQDILEPERIYPLLRTTAYYPHYINLKEYLGYDSWIWTSSDMNISKNSQNQLVIISKYPVRQTHYFVIYGLRPFTGIVLHNIPWPGDYRFQRYSEGYYYNPNNTTLYFKLRQRRTEDSIVISLGASS